MREKLGKRELDRKRIEDSQTLQLQDPNFRQGWPPPRPIPALRTAIPSASDLQQADPALQMLTACAH